MNDTAPLFFLLFLPDTGSPETRVRTLVWVFVVKVERSINLYFLDRQSTNWDFWVFGVMFRTKIKLTNRFRFFPLLLDVSRLGFNNEWSIEVRSVRTSLEVDVTLYSLLSLFLTVYFYTVPNILTLFTVEEGV